LRIAPRYAWRSDHPLQITVTIQIQHYSALAQRGDRLQSPGCRPGHGIAIIVRLTNRLPISPGASILIENTRQPLAAQVDHLIRLLWTETSHIFPLLPAGAFHGR